MRPLIADGGSLTVLRRLASFAWGEWRVDWPESVPEEQRPQIEEGREFGYVYDMPRQVGRMGRRFVRSDVSITGADYGPDGVVLPYSGFSDVEQALDEAAGRTDGDAFFEREIGRGGLNGLVPFEDFDVGDQVDVGVWSVVLPSQIVAEVQEVTEPGVGVVDWRVRVSGDLVPDDVQRKRQNLELERQVWQERRERMKADAREAQVRRSAVAGERSAREAAIEAEASARKRGDEDEARNRQVALEAEERKRAADLKRIRDFLGGAGASDAALLSQLAAVNAQIIGLSDGKAQPAPGLLNSYLALNTLLWQQQQEINRINERFRLDAEERQRQDAILNARQEEALRRAQTAIDNEEKYRMWPGAGPANSAWFSPRNNPFVEVRAEGNTSTARLKRRCTGYIQLMQKMTDGRMDMWGWNVDHPAGTTFDLSGGSLLKVDQFFILYQLWEP